MRRTLAGIRLSERNQRRLLRMNAQTKAGKPLGPHRQDAPGVRFPLAANAKGIRKAEPEASALHSWPYRACEPFIQDMMPEDIRQHR